MSLISAAPESEKTQLRTSYSPFRERIQPLSLAWITALILSNSAFAASDTAQTALRQYAKERAQNPKTPAADLQKKLLKPTSDQIRSQTRTAQEADALIRQIPTTPAKRLSAEEIKARELKKTRRKAYLDARKAPKSERARRLAEFKKNWGTRLNPKTPGVLGKNEPPSRTRSQPIPEVSRPEVVIDGRQFKREVDFGKKEKRDFSDLPTAPPAELMGD